MAEVSITIAGRSYDVFCADGEENDLMHLAAIVDAKAQQVQTLLGNVNEVRTLLFAALFLADEQRTMASAPPRGAPAATPVADAMASPMATNVDLTPIGTALERLAERLEDIAARGR